MSSCRDRPRRRRPPRPRRRARQPLLGGSSKVGRGSTVPTVAAERIMLSGVPLQMVTSVPRLPAAAILIVVVAALVGAVSSESRPVEYRAQAQLSLTRTPDGAELADALARLRPTADRAIGRA